MREEFPELEEFLWGREPMSRRLLCRISGSVYGRQHKTAYKESVRFKHAGQWKPRTLARGGSLKKASARWKERLVLIMKHGSIDL
jgi:hypothetical protein